jgi:predicted DCC family thiol-disulfide oxidoreductase YuxK
MFCWMLLILVLCCGVVIERTRREFESASAAATTPPVVLFDGVCNLCDMFVDLSMRFAPRDAQTGLPVLRVAALQSDVGRKLLVEQCRLDANDLSSVVLVESDGSCHRQSDAALRVHCALRGAVAAVASRVCAFASLCARHCVHVGGVESLSRVWHEGEVSRANAARCRLVFGT